MHFLHRALNENTALASAVAALSDVIDSNALKLGLLLDLNPLWLAAYRAQEAGLNVVVPMEAIEWSHMWMQPGGMYLGDDVPDLSRTFDFVDWLTERYFGRSTKQFQPYLLRIVARPLRDPDELTRHREERQALLTAAREAQIPTLVETRAPPRLLAAAGDRILSNGVLGTLGGFLHDNITGDEFAVTCGHVVSQGIVSDAHGNAIGKCNKIAAPHPLPTGVRCHAACGSVNELDLALVPVPQRGANTVNAISQNIYNGDIVEMNGAVSGRRRYQVGAAVIDHEIGGSCWSRLFQIRAIIPATILPVAVYMAITPPPQNGDSGSWLTRNTSEWSGMVIAADQFHGYALAATTVVSQGNKKFGTDLSL